ncbi:hypothetical protein JHK82_032118 [Glycine max]|nr:hypothetical protein JHK85_032792 [Glycine max]KAG4995392.1 hypothetical protein JHK86_032219 [Glycine max]KAG5125381.1 hypothetical protein JHK82_032118 [Glycine max]
MGFSSKEEKSKRILRGLKTLFFLITMVISLLLFSAPVLLVIADALVPSALLSSLSQSSFSMETLASHFHNYDFRYSLIDIPLVSIIRSFIIFCVYSLCDGPRLSHGPYLGITTMCSVLSLMFVSFKAVYIFSVSGIDRSGYVRATEIALFVCSCALAVGHVVVAYRTSCRERRKLLVYKIDIEALWQHSLLTFQNSQIELVGNWAEEDMRSYGDVGLLINSSIYSNVFDHVGISACKNGYPRYLKIPQEERIK